MIIITSNYSSVSNPEMTQNFIIKSENVIKVWDITTHMIGIRFISSYDKYEYKINLEDPDKHILATNILKMVKDDLDITISGRVEIK